MDKTGERNFPESDNYSGEAINDKMNDWKGELISPADSYIEWRFEHKCKQLSNGFRIITEWRKQKLHYVSLIGTTVFDFQHYSRHDETHSIAILEAIESLLGKKRIDMLSAGDLWLLLEAAYSHDAGMTLDYDEIRNLWISDDNFSKYIRECIEGDFGDLKTAALYYKQMDNSLRNRTKMEGIQNQGAISFEKDWPVLSQNYFSILVAEYVRKQHADRVMHLLDGVEDRADTIIPARLYRVSAKVASLHGKNFEEILTELKYSTKGFGSGNMHPQFVAAMLRIGDLLDMDNNRFNPYAVKHFGRLPFASMLHLKKHKSISHISISESEINAEAHASEYDVCLLADDWFKAIDREVKNLICYWNMIVPEALLGCTLKPSCCSVFLLEQGGQTYQKFDSELRREFTINKKKLINILIGTSIYEGEMDFIREYLQNAIDASKMQLWIDLNNGKFEYQRNQEVLDKENLTPFDLERSVYDNYGIKFSIDWNADKDKIELKIIDQGIGIEKEYLSELSNIGTGWRGRSKYAKELKQILKWLYPTGGFGIGIQSAFMVTDTVELVTKSDKNLKGYKVILNCPDKGGSISVEELSDYSVRGTTVKVQIEPEKIQYWMEILKKQEKESGNSYFDKQNYIFDRNKWDEFDPDANLSYVQNFFKNYIHNVVPDPLFPIEITCTGRNRVICKNPYWLKENYWERKSDYDVRELVDGDSKYLCFFKAEDGAFIFWERQKCILGEIHLASENDKDRKIVCFKNIRVRSINYSEFELFNSYDISIDFMGFHAYECLKVHRNSFNEEFPAVDYCKKGFRVFLCYLWESLQNKETLPKSIVEKLSASWEEYQLQLLRMIAFYDDPVSVYQVADDDELISAMQYTFSRSDEGGIQVGKNETAVKKSEMIVNLKNFFKNNLESNDIGRADINGIMVLPDSEILYQLKKEGAFKQEKGVMRSKVGKWLLGENENLESNLGYDVFNMLLKGEMIITHPFTVNMLLKDSRLVKKLVNFVKVDGIGSIIILTMAEKEKELEELEFYETLWKQGSEGGRPNVTGTNAERYKKLCVNSLPFQACDDLPHLISPISKQVSNNVEKKLENNQKITYEDFRLMAWGARGQENQSYQMLINWVTRHQYHKLKLSRLEIADAYEELLRDMFQKLIYMRIIEIGK